MKQRLIEILKTALREDCKVSPVALERSADALIGAGVVAPKFKVGDVAWYALTNKFLDGVYSSEVLAIEIRKDEIYCTLADDWGDYEDELHLTEVEAWVAFNKLIQRRKMLTD